MELIRQRLKRIPYAEQNAKRVEAVKRIILSSAVAIAAVLWLTTIAAQADLSQPSPTPVLAATNPSSAPQALNIAFDQIDRTISGTGSPPPLGGFQKDLAAIQRYQNASFGPSSGQIATNIAMQLAQQALAAINPVASLLGGFAAQAQANAARKKAEEDLKAMMGPNPGVFTRYYFYNGWTRIEVASLVLILRPDRHAKILLNPLTKTYRVEDTNVTPPPAPQDDTESVPPNPVKADVVVTTRQIDGATIAGQPTTGFSSDATLALSGGLDPCSDARSTATQLEYFTTIAEPLRQATDDARSFYTLALPQDCSVPLDPQINGAAPTGQMYAYRLVTVVRNAALAARATPHGNQLDQGDAMRAMFGANLGPDANYMKLSERSNFRLLSDADASLFEIPAGYTQTN